ncbi:hypothetical protein A0O28_0090980 [Trichoderma guizhouense]|uniref:Uncharacterized protein n=1 Tax=Trichoderma guizhouense TaxID=1491466 RepID=A0A1T3CV49_9HYPO|nr:hypothetical protein A0O28_0090980 [Trichoderma guizhouense]
MAETLSTQELSQLSPLEWVMPRSFISQILCFPSTNPRIYEVLRDGLAGTLADVPYLASRIVARTHPKGSVALSSPCDSLGDLFRVNDLATTVDYNDLKARGFQPSLFDGLDLFSADLNPARDGNDTASDICSMRIAVNCRSRYNPPLPKNYLGAAFGVSLVTAKKVDLMDIGRSSGETYSISAIANVAAAIRQSVNVIDEDKMNTIVNHLSAQEDVTGLKLCEQPASVSIVSWADEGVYELDWGIELGHCEVVRLPTFKTKRYPVVFPRLPNGDLEVLVSFDPELLNRWRAVHSVSPWKA